MGVQLTVLAVLLLLTCLVYRLSLHNRFVDYIPVDENPEENSSLQFEFEAGEDILQPEKIQPHDGFVEVQYIPQKPGNVDVDLRWEDGDPEGSREYAVGPLMTVYNRRTGDFTGDRIVLISITTYFLLAAAIMMRCFFRSRGPHFYSYMTIYTAGFSLFAFDIGILMLTLTFRHIVDPVNNNMFAIYDIIRSIGFHFMLFTSPFILIFAAAMCVSNIELLRHESRRLQNFLGILISIILVGGEYLGYLMHLSSYSGSSRHRIIMRETAMSVYTTAYVYFECMLIGAIICGLCAARHKPDPDKDYCIILGCRFRKDGTLTPLLKGRVDRAVLFAKEQKAAGGKDLVFIPSGGQGPNESMAEAEAMKRYLLECGIPEQQILSENQSKNTYQNMEFSKKLIDRRTKDARVIFSTTNYHVFRSGVWAGLAGLPAEGIGSHTKWWFWPNAFIRECVGLLKNRWKQELIGLAVLTAFFAALSMVTGL